MENKQHRLAGGMRLTGRVIGLVAALFLMIMLIGGAVTETEPVEAAGVLLGTIGVTALAGCILSFWRERMAGILLVLVAIGLGIHIGVYAGRNHFLVWLMLGLPYLVAGGLLLTAWWLERKAA